MSKQDKKKKCDHQWELVFTQYQYPVEIGGTAKAIEYAYLFCEKCLMVKKVEVKNYSEVENDLFEKQIRQKLAAEIQEMKRKKIGQCIGK